MRLLKAPKMLYDKGKPVAVQFDMASYREILERLEDYEDARMLEEMHKQPRQSHPLQEVLDEFELTQTQ